jgi:hypothetical protein
MSGDAEPVPQISSFLEDLVYRHKRLTWAALLGGGILSLLGPLVFTFLYILLALPEKSLKEHGFWGVFGLTCAYTLPLLFLLAGTTGGSLLERFVDASDDSFAMRMARGRVGAFLLMLDIANVGPTLVREGFRRIKGESQMSRLNSNRVAMGIQTLLADEYGMSPSKLIQPGETADDLEPLLAFLIFFHVVDLSKKGDRVWLTSRVRSELVQAGAVRALRRSAKSPGSA